MRIDVVTNISRRGALLGMAAGALILAARLPRAMAQERKYGGDAMEGGLKDDPRIFLSIADDGTITLLCQRAEMGQGIRTSWAAVVADELEADLARVRVHQAPGDEGRFGNQNTDGSRSMRQHFLPLRRFAASAPRPARCWRAKPRHAGTSLRALSAPRTVRFCTLPAGGGWGSACWHAAPRPGRCRPATS